MPRKFTPKKHQPYTFINTCGSKRQYRNEKDAVRAADYQMLVSPSASLSTYRCPVCNHWHLTSQDPKSS